MEGYGAHLPYHIRTTPDGGAEIDPEELAPAFAIDCLDELHRQVREAGFSIAAVAGSAFWHSFCGVDADGSPRFPILHLLDTRSAAEVARVPDTHASTGCVPHSSYWPAKLLWLEKHRAEQFRGHPPLAQLPRISVRETVRRIPRFHVHGLRHRIVESERQQLR